jgi:hypothetical protein
MSFKQISSVVNLFSFYFLFLTVGLFCRFSSNILLFMVVVLDSRLFFLVFVVFFDGFTDGVTGTSNPRVLAHLTFFVLSLACAWSLSRKTRNRIAHTLNGNGVWTTAMIISVAVLVIALPLLSVDFLFHRRVRTAAEKSDSGYIALGWLEYVRDWMAASVFGHVIGGLLILFSPVLFVLLFVPAFFILAWKQWRRSYELAKMTKVKILPRTDGAELEGENVEQVFGVFETPDPEANSGRMAWSYPFSVISPSASRVHFAPLPTRRPVPRRVPVPTAGLEEDELDDGDDTSSVETIRGGEPRAN